MAQPKIDGVGHGVPRMLYASDGSNWYAILVDSDGHVKADIVSAALGTDGATATNQATMITALQLIDDLRAALGSVNTDDLQVDVKTSALPTDAATQTTLASCLTSLQIIDDLRNALGSIGTDRLFVDPLTYPGSNALGNFPFGYNDVYGETKTAGPVTGNQTLSGSAVPAGEVWVITHVAAGHTDATARVTAIRGYIGGALISIASNRALAQYAVLDEQGSWVLKKDDYMQIVVEALTAGSYLQCWFSGYKMKVA